jgi:hypothetical protein
LSPELLVVIGGVNPFLWRPAAGIVSFNIPSHKIDLSPFVGQLLSSSETGESHTISFSVYGNNVNDGGLWYLDASIFITYDDLVGVSSSSSGKDKTDFDLMSVFAVRSLFVDGIGAYPVGGFVDSRDSTPITNVISSISHNSSNEEDVTLTFETWGTHTYQVMGVWEMSDGSRAVRGVNGLLTEGNKNSLIGTTTGVSGQVTIAAISAYAIGM